MRLNSYISATGLCSRRAADKLIEQGRVRINGEIPVLGTKVKEGDEVCVDGKVLEKKENDVYIAFNKPVGITCTTERHIKGNIIDLIKYPERIFPIGRLDKDSEGLILLTNDGSVVNEILREENNHQKEYIVTVNKKITPDFITGMSNGVKIFNPVKKDHTITKKCPIERMSDRSFKITLSQGLNRQIRRMCSYFGYSVVKLKRIKIMDITLGELEIGQWRPLTEAELKQIAR